MRLAAYAGASTVAAAGVVVRAFNQRANFYSACVYLAQSNACLMILTNLILLLVCSFFYGSQRLFYGRLRPIEVEQLYEKAWFAITETCLAMTIFREEVGAWFMIMFVALLAGKVWGWIGEGRVEILEQQPPANPRLFHARLSVSLAISMIYDLWFLAYTINTVVQQARPNMMVMFLFEFAILAASSLSTTLRYAISLVEADVVRKQTKVRLEERRAEVRAQREEMIRQREAAAASTDSENSVEAPTGELPSEDDIDEMDIEVPGWEEKGQWVLSLDLATDLIKLAIYSIFFFILLTFYGLPIHIMRDLFLTASSFIKRLAAFLKYRRATRDMNERYPDATVEDITREDTCIICREEMRPWSITNPPADAPVEGAAAPPQPRPSTLNERSRPKKLPCGHILHLGCLKSWLERQQVCPTCRRPVVETLAQVAARERRAQTGTHQGQPPNGAAQPGGNDQFPPPPVPNPVRMLNLGPFRVGFGHGQLGDFVNGAQQNGGQNLPVQPGQRVFGFDIGFGRHPERQPHPPPPGPAGLAASFAAGTAMREQLRNIEAVLSQEIRNLQLTQQELMVVQALQNELTRLRMLQGVGVPQINGTTPNLRPMPSMPTIPIGSGLPLRPDIQRHGPAPGAVAIPSGHPDLPSGVTIPEGWTLLPLERMDANGRSVPTATTTAPPQDTARSAADAVTNAVQESARTASERSAIIERSDLLSAAAAEQIAHVNRSEADHAATITQRGSQAVEQAHNTENPQETEVGSSTLPTTEVTADSVPIAEPQPQSTATTTVTRPLLASFREQIPSPPFFTPTDPETPPTEHASVPVPNTAAVPPTFNSPQLPNWGSTNQHPFNGGSGTLGGSSSDTAHARTSELATAEEPTVPAPNEQSSDAKASVEEQAVKSEDKGKGKSASVEEEPDVEHGV